MVRALTRNVRNAHVISAKDAMEAFRCFDADDTGMMEFEEIQNAFKTMLAPALVDISSFRGSSYNPETFRHTLEWCARYMPQYDVIGNVMKYIRENRQSQDDDGEDIKDNALAKLFKQFDQDGSGEMGYIELFKLFQFLKIPLRLLFQAGAVQDGTVTKDEFGPMLRKIHTDHPDLDVAEKINTFVASISSDGAPQLPGGDLDPESDPASEEQEENEPPRKKALLVGINYIGSNCELGGCINDSRNQLRILTEHFGFAEDNILLLTEDQGDDSKLPTAEHMRSGFDWLVDGAAEGDLLVFAYSGHGSQLPCTDGSEPDGKNEILCPLDLQKDWKANSISDDYLHDVFYNRLPDGVKCVNIFDCCHSGTMQDLSCTREFRFDEDMGPKDRFLAPPDEMQADIDSAKEAAKMSGASRGMSPEDAGKKLVWTISGCQDNQTSADATIGGQRQGAMTWALLSALEEGGLKGPYYYRYDRLLTIMRKKLRERGFAQIPAMGAGDDSLFERYYLANKP